MPSVALVAIVRDEERSVGRMIYSAKDLVDEVIIVDTGSRDDTVTIARAAGAKVTHFDWIGDFAAARNMSLQLTAAPWRLILDADEWLAPETDDLRNFCRQEAVFVGRIKISSGFHSEVSGRRQLSHAHSWVSRLLPYGVKYVGKIHEQPEHNFPIRNVPIYAWHDGYEDAQLQRKGDRNYRMLQKLISAGEADSYYRFQYARELVRKRWVDEAAAQLLMALSASSDGLLWRKDLVCLSLNVFGSAKRFEDGVALIEKERDRFSKSSDFWFCVGGFYMDLAQARPWLGTQVLELIEVAFLRCIDIGESEEAVVAGRGSYLAAQNLYAFYVACNKEEQAHKFQRLAQELYEAATGQFDRQTKT
jgi:glycosyltransferase involved in cell wall biosynthesis